MLCRQGRTNFGKGTNVDINQSIVRPFFQGGTNIDNILVIGGLTLTCPQGRVLVLQDQG